MGCKDGDTELQGVDLTHPVIATLDHPLSGKPERGEKEKKHNIKILHPLCAAERVAQRSRGELTRRHIELPLTRILHIIQPPSFCCG